MACNLSLDLDGWGRGIFCSYGATRIALHTRCNAQMLRTGNAGAGGSRMAVNVDLVLRKLDEECCLTVNSVCL